MRRFGERRAVLRIIVVWGITAVALHGFAAVIPGVKVSGWEAAIVGAAAIGLLNALVWPLFVRVALPITVLTLGVGALLANGVFIYLGSQLVPGFEVDSIWSGVAVAVGLTLVNTVVTTLLAIDDDDFYYRQVVRRLAEGRAEEIEEAYPDLIPTLRAHPGIGFLLVRSSRRGAVVLGRAGANYLDEGTVEGEDPLAPFGPGAGSHIKRTDGFAHVADIMVNSAYEAQRDEVYAFEELVGSHGGMGGPQSFPFILLPTPWAVPDQSIVGAESMHQWMRRWLKDLGHTEYVETPSAPESAG